MDSTQNFSLEKVWLKEILSWTKMPTRVKDFGLKCNIGLGEVEKHFYQVILTLLQVILNQI